MRFNTTLITLLIAAGSMAQAQDFKFGVQGTLSLPQSDLGKFVDNKPGYGLGIHTLIGLGGNGSAIVPRLDYLHYQGSKDDFFGYKADTKMDLLLVGVDYNYYFGGKPGEGGFVGGGIGFANAKVHATSQTYSSMKADGSKGTTYFDLCGGYAFTANAAIEIRFFSASISGIEFDVEGAPGTTGTAKIKDTESKSGQGINVSFLYRF